MGNRMLAQDIAISLHDETPGITLGLEPTIMAEVDRFDGVAQPDIAKTWPSGAKKYWHQLVGLSYQVTMTAAQLGGGFLSLAAKQHQQVKLNTTLPKVRLLRKAQPKNLPAFSETYMGGIVSAAGNHQTTGNAAATTDVTIEFEDFQ